ncbi:hypothetical protein VHEMI00132 [[Torrubiella] hemipterigena]|uniref:CBF1-interacting co-repressor CIR N-terminal domain-containing protein n=1 Tax=[Torrubiella] hemipterigena TaxID=1531966 RepID=A0A0A1SPJ0_9HYPO|nr:hypothetical protein VHEMI00132 [[Torrubiella] hemipterigena]
MPLHLLGKKSWNVYNADNIARVRQDEAAARDAEAAEEQRMQEIDSERRIAILRGEAPPPLEEGEQHDEPASSQGSRNHTSRRRERKRYGEDDTDFEIRLASTRTSSSDQQLQERRQPSQSAFVTNHAPNGETPSSDKNERGKGVEGDDLLNMRFSNAAGKQGSLTPWYSRSDASNVDTVSKDAFGRDDPKRKERDTARLNSNDPLAMMKRGAARVRELKQERRAFEDERQMELKELRQNDRHREKPREKTRREHRRRSRSPRSEDRKHRSHHRRRPRDRGSSSARANDGHSSRREHHER